MKVLIAESDAALAGIWARHLERHGATVLVADRESAAIDVMTAEKVDVIILDLVLDHGSAFAVADFANFRQPGARVIFVTNTSFFSDGSIFRHIPNACAFLPSATPPEDLAAMVDYFGVAH